MKCWVTVRRLGGVLVGGGDMKVSTPHCSRPAFLPRDLSAHPIHLDSDRIN